MLCRHWNKADAQPKRKSERAKANEVEMYISKRGGRVASGSNSHPAKTLHTTDPLVMPPDMPVTRSAVRNARLLAAVDPNRTETYVTVTPSATGQGTHTKWHYPQTDDQQTEKAADHPLFSLSPMSSLSSISSDTGSPTEQRFVTPPPREPSESVLKTPVKKLRRDPERIGFNGVAFWRSDESGITERVVFQPPGYPTRLVLDADSPQELEHLQDHVDVLLQDSKEAGRFLQDYFSKQKDRDAQLRALLNAGTDSEGDLPVSYGTARNGQRLGPEGTHLLGPHGTELFDEAIPSDTEMDTNTPRRLRRARPLLAEPTIRDAHAAKPSVAQHGPVTPVRKGARLGPHGTELIDVVKYQPPERVNTVYFSGQSDTRSFNGDRRQ